MSKLLASLLVVLTCSPLATAVASPRHGRTPLVCTAKRPAACPGGGAPACTDGKWQCDQLPQPKPKTCAPANRPAACPGGGGATCDDGAWQCKDLPAKTCEAAKKPAACPGGGAASCSDGAWQCKALPRR